MKKKKPFSSISFFGSDTKIFLDEIAEKENAIALYIPEDDLIFLDKRDSQKFKSFSHELFHLLAHRSGIKQTSMSHDVEEILAENFSVLLDECLDDIIKIRAKLNRLK